MTDMGNLEGASPARAGALIVRFVLELALLAGAAVVGWHLADGWWRWLVAILAVLLVASIWGLFVSPKAAIRVPRVGVFLIEAALFVGAGVGLFALGFGIPAAIGLAVWAVDRIVLALIKE